MISVRLKSFCANFVKDAKGAKVEYSRGLTGARGSLLLDLAHSRECKHEKAARSHFLCLSGFLLLSPQLLVTSHCVVLQRPIILEFIISIHFFYKQVSIATADETSTCYEAVSYLQNSTFDPN